MGVMAPRIALIATPATLPSTVTIGGVPTPLHDLVQIGVMNGAPTREYRLSSNPNRLLFVQRGPAVTLPDTRSGFLCLVWVNASVRDGDDSFFASVRGTPEFQSLVVAHWPTTLDVDGSLIISALEADSGAAALVALAAWPSKWRKMLAGDALNTPTGARIVGDCLA